MKIIVLCGTVVTFFVTACSKTDHGQSAARAGSLEGDVYLVMKSGDVRKGAGNRVTVIPDSDSLRGRLAQTCRASDSARTTLLQQSDAALKRAQNGPVDYTRSTDEQVERNFAPAQEAAKRLESYDRLALPLLILLSEKGPSTGTGMEAHYAIDSLMPGPVLLWAETTIGGNHYVWLRSSTVIAGQRTKADLDNSTIFDARACSIGKGQSEVEKAKSPARANPSS